MHAMLVIATLVLLLIAPHLAWPQKTPGYTYHQITFPKSVTTHVTGINDRAAARGDMVGFFETPDGQGHEFVKWGGAYVELEDLWPCAGHNITGLNNDRVLVGSVCGDYGFGIPNAGFIHIGASREHQETRTDMLNVPGSSGTYATGINDAMTVVGAYSVGHDLTTRGFIFQDGVYTSLPPLEGWDVWAADINNRDQIVGSVYERATGISYGFLYEDGDYQFFAHPDSSYTWSGGLNDHGHIVGQFWVDEWETDAMSCCWRGFLFKDSTFTTINTSRDDQALPAGINNAGHIAGTFYRPYDNWQPHGFVAVPKPPPKPKKPAKMARR